MFKASLLQILVLGLLLLILAACTGNPPLTVAEPTNTVVVSTLTATATPVPTSTRTPIPTSTPFKRDNFDDNSINAFLWDVHPWGTGPTIDESNGKIVAYVPADCTKVPQPIQKNCGVGYFGNFHLVGDFDIQVDYQIIKWPKNNGASISLNVLPGGSAERAKWGGTTQSGQYITNYFQSEPGVIFDIAGDTNTKDLQGKLRLTRVGDQLTGYFFRSGEWVGIRKGKVDPGPVTVNINVFCHSGYDDNGGYYNYDPSAYNDIQVELDNFIINQGEVR